MVAFHFHFLPRGGHILLEDDIAVQQVVHLQLQVEVLVQAISGAVTNYEQSRVALHNSIVLLEMLTNVKVITDK